MRLRVLIKRYFVTGLLVTLPIAGTYFVLSALLRALEGVLGELLHTHLSAHYYPGLGIAVLLVGIFLVGLLTANVIGRWFVRLYERVLKRLPVVRSIYSAIKSVVHTVSMQGQEKFKGVVLAEFPRPGMWMLGFVVADSEGEIATRVGERPLSLFVPTSPNPTSGFLVFVREDEVTYLSISVEEAMKAIMSGGIYSAGTGDTDGIPDRLPEEIRYEVARAEAERAREAAAQAAREAEKKRLEAERLAEAARRAGAVRGDNGPEDGG
ncbi:MAG: DUF502 domain-containing protein [Nitrospirae bacterium]|nr:DUF502 domain-containing protein [Nitrospirota bacterium]